MLRIIPRIDIKGDNLLKPVQFDGQRVMGKAKDFAKAYAVMGADELFVNDTVASLYQRRFQRDVLEGISSVVDVPITFAGGISSISDVGDALRAGADKIAINTQATKTPELITEAAEIYGTQCVVGSIEYYMQDHNIAEVWIDGGRQRTGLELIRWAKELERLGAGELIVSSIRRDGLGQGYDLDVMKQLSSELSIPIIASCGAGGLEDFLDLVQQTDVCAACAASVFHYHISNQMLDSQGGADCGNLRMGKSIDVGNDWFLRYGYGGFFECPVTHFSISELKNFLRKNSIDVRLND